MLIIKEQTHNHEEKEDEKKKRNGRCTNTHSLLKHKTKEMAFFFVLVAHFPNPISNPCTNRHNYILMDCWKAYDVKNTP
jgi:hypothetical protein